MKKNIPPQLPKPGARQAALRAQKNKKMAISAQEYVGGNPERFYDWLRSAKPARLHVPKGPAVWICGDCHIGNFGPIANSRGEIEFQLRDFDQTVIGNPVHDLLRLGLSLTSVARGYDLSGLTSVHMLEHLMEGYLIGLSDSAKKWQKVETPDCVRRVLEQADKRSWRDLAEDSMDTDQPKIPLGKNFWPLSKSEQKSIAQIFEIEDIAHLAAVLRAPDDTAKISVADAAYWVKGCSSLGNQRYAVLLKLANDRAKKPTYCLMDIKQATKPDAPSYRTTRMPDEHAHRVLEGATHLSPYLGERMRVTQMGDSSMFIRELLPADIKLEVTSLTQDEAVKTARYLAFVIARAHARQMDNATREHWRSALSATVLPKKKVPDWLWDSIVDLMVSHEAGYLEHCRVCIN